MSVDKGELGVASASPSPGLRPFGAEPAAQSQAEPLVPNAAWPDELTPELADILGRQCFTFIRFSRVYRAAGFDIPKRAEDEQAFFLHRFLGHWFRHGDGWREAAESDLREVHARAASGIVAATAGETREAGLDERSEQSPTAEGRDAQPSSGISHDTKKG